MQIRINEVEFENKGKYDALKVGYNCDGKDSEKNLVSFKNEDVFEIFRDAKQDEVYDVKSVKEGKYWQWVQASKVDGGPKSSASKGKATTTGNTYATQEERAKTQVYIVRQSSIGHAIEYNKAVGNDFNVESVLQVAKEFEKYVFGTASEEVNTGEID